jgi:DNA-directed RNA polymerase subunit RPC12/RpoP
MNALNKLDERDSLHGLACPNCGGMVTIPEGQLIVTCPYCDMRSLVRGERGIQRYQVPRQVDREAAMNAMQRFLKGHQAIARDAAKKAILAEAFLAHLPFWVDWAHVLAWAFGEQRKRRNDRTYYEPREVKVASDMSWNGAACDVGEFGVESVPLGPQPLEAFDPQVLHESGMVFEPVGSSIQAKQMAEGYYKTRVDQQLNLDRINQTFIRFVRQRRGLVYYPLWVLRYLYRGRYFQVVVDAHSGHVLYGKAPGNTLYRAAMLVGGMALGALLAVDASAAAFFVGAKAGGDGSDIFILIGLALLAGGLGLMWQSYRTFRYGEQYEYRKSEKSFLADLLPAKKLIAQIEDMTTWTNR